MHALESFRLGLRPDSRHPFELSSVLAVCRQGQENQVLRYTEGKSETPWEYGANKVSRTQKGRSGAAGGAEGTVEATFFDLAVEIYVNGFADFLD